MYDLDLGVFEPLFSEDLDFVTLFFNPLLNLFFDIFGYQVCIDLGAEHPYLNIVTDLENVLDD